MNLVTYRYLWQTNKKGELNQTFVKIVTGSDDEHNRFMELLRKNKTVTMASRMYICEYHVDKMDIPETIKTLNKEKKEDETN